MSSKKNLNYENVEKYVDKEDIYCVDKLTHKSKLYVIAVVSNPARFKRRYQLYNEFCERIHKEKQSLV